MLLGIGERVLHRGRVVSGKERSQLVEISVNP
jgi:hypothetical protein